MRDVASQSLSAIANESKILAGKARDGKLVLEDYKGGTVSLSNLGMLGIDEMFPVISPPQALILGVGGRHRTAVESDGRIELATVMAATASFDHGVIDGATGVKFMEVFRILIENPMRLMA